MTTCVVPAADQMAAAALLEAQAALEQAQINLGYTEIRAPIAGRIGRAAFSVGNLAGLDSGVLATIVSQDPIYVTFPVSQRQQTGLETGDKVIVDGIQGVRPGVAVTASEAAPRAPQGDSQSRQSEG